MINRYRLQAVLGERGPLRYTPAGIPALDVVLRHESVQTQLGQPRRLDMDVEAVMFAELALDWQRRPLGSAACFTGFLAPTRKGSRRLKFTINEVEHLSEPGSTDSRG